MMALRRTWPAWTVRRLVGLHSCVPRFRAHQQSLAATRSIDSSCEFSRGHTENIQDTVAADCKDCASVMGWIVTTPPTDHKGPRTDVQHHGAHALGHSPGGL